MYHKILVPLDGSPLAEKALPNAVNLAKHYKAEIVLLGVAAIHHVPYITEAIGDESTDLWAVDPEKQKEEEHCIRAYLDQKVKQLKTDGLNASSVVLTGPAAEKIIDYAKDNEIQVIVMSTHGRSGIRRWLLGSVADRVLRGATVPVLLVRAETQ